MLPLRCAIARPFKGIVETCLVLQQSLIVAFDRHILCCDLQFHENHIASTYNSMKITLLRVGGLSPHQSRTHAASCDQSLLLPARTHFSFCLRGNKHHLA